MGEKGGVGWLGVKSRVASFRSLSCGFFPLFSPLPLSVPVLQSPRFQGTFQKSMLEMPVELYLLPAIGGRLCVVP
jgi:hypothetical protein